MKKIDIIGAAVITLLLMGLLIIPFYHPDVLQIMWLVITISIFYSFIGVSKSKQLESYMILIGVLVGISFTIVTWVASRSAAIPMILLVSVMDILLTCLYIALFRNPSDQPVNIYYASNALPSEATVV